MKRIDYNFTRRQLILSMFVVLCIVSLLEKVFAIEANDLSEQQSKLGITGTQLGLKRGLDVAIPGEYRDAFGRLRVSEQFPLFFSSNVYYNTDSMISLLSGVGATLTHLPNESAVSLQVGTANGERAVRQSAIYVPYIPGKSQLALVTGVIGVPKANNVRRVGLFDDKNGIFFQVSSTGVSVVRRTYTSGAVVDNAVAQTSWNIDKLDGTGAFKKTIDFSKAQIFVIDFQWLGVGRVRVGLDLDGEVYYVHEFLNANAFTTVYMSQATLPVRYENLNTGITASSTTLKEICSAVVSEGSYTPPVVEFTANNGATTDAITARELVFAVRLKAAFDGKENRKSLFLEGFTPLATGAVLVDVVKCRTPSAITATWVSAGASSSVEYSEDISAITCATSTNIESYWVGSNTRTTAPCQGCSTYSNPNRLISQNIASDNSDIFLFYATSSAGSINVSSVAQWLEYF